ncbi:hypothetical protein ACFQ3N_02625 [Virgibacillus byunsanensis]|uniref:Uncharacterized protein n=1 Tax=Virgibacillus byunsanensis TaxID=570945 RepID=A0ABW3LG10_9BACI
MENETMLKEILNALTSHSEQVNNKFGQMDKKFEQKFDQMDQKFEQKFEEMDKKFERKFEEMDKRFDRLETKVDGIRMDLTETQKTTNFLLGKIVQHDEKLLQLSEESEQYK